MRNDDKATYTESSITRQWAASAPICFAASRNLKSTQEFTGNQKAKILSPVTPIISQWKRSSGLSLIYANFAQIQIYSTGKLLLDLLDLF